MIQKKHKTIMIALLLFFITSPLANAAPMIIATFGDITNVDDYEQEINFGDTTDYSFKIVHDYGTEYSDIKVFLLKVGDQNFLQEIYNKRFTPDTGSLADLIFTERNLLVTPDYYLTEGDYRIHIQATQKIDGTTETTTRSMRLNLLVTSPVILQNPTADFTYSPSSPEVNEAVTFTSTSTDADGTITNYEWKVDGTVVGAGNTLSYTFTNTGSHNVELKVTDNDGLTDTKTKTVNVVSVATSPIADFYYAPFNPQVGTVMSFTSNSTDSDGSIVFYAWKIDGDIVGTSKTMTHTFASAGSHQVSLTVTDDDALTDTKTKTINVINANSAPYFTSSPVTEGIVGEEYIYDANAIDDENDVLEFGLSQAPNGMTINEDTGLITWTPTTKGEFSVVLYVSDGINPAINQFFTINVTENIIPALQIDNFDCNPDINGDNISDVVYGEELRCAVHVKGDIQDVRIEFDFSGLENFPICYTDFKGNCASDITVNDMPGTYTVYATATKQGYESTTIGPISVQVWTQRYEIRNLKIYEDEFSTESYSFFRKEPMFIAFDIYDTINDEQLVPGTNDADVINSAYLKVNTGSAELEEWTTPIKLSKVNQDGLFTVLKNKLLKTFGIKNTGLYKFHLNEIPITDDFLGQGKVFAFTINFIDNTAGQETRDVNVLNNELIFNQPPKIKIHPGSTTTLNLASYLSDIETQKNEILTTYKINPLLSITKISNTTFLIESSENFNKKTNVEFTADDTDGSKVTRNIVFEPEIPNTVIDPKAIITGPKSVRTEKTITYDGSGSYDPDGKLVNYRWQIIKEGTTLHEEQGVHMLKIEYVFPSKGTYSVKLFVTDNQGNTAYTALTVNVKNIYKQPEQIMPMGEEDGIWVDYFDIYGTNYGTITYEDEFSISARVRNERKDDIRGATVSFSLPELGFQIKSHKFDLKDNGDYETISFMGYLPFTEQEVPPGEYIALITVNAEDILRTKYYPLVIE
ncbi:PKD domain-containing protein [Candidatus Woesearchaeota archaeon]|nr:PKD domain-containing protein [Candidatus Woesearchaeota archaeon]